MQIHWVQWTWADIMYIVNHYGIWFHLMPFCLQGDHLLLRLALKQDKKNPRINNK